MEYYINEKELILGEKKILFKNEIFEYEFLESAIIISLKNQSTGDIQKQPKDNIYAIDYNGEIIWRVSEITSENIFYSGFYIEKTPNGEMYLVVIDCRGIRYSISLSDYSLIKKEGYRF